MNRIGTRLAIIGGVITALAACNSQQPAMHLSPPEATVSKPVQEDIVNWAEFTGRMEAVHFVKITPRVSGCIVNIPFSEGDIVHKGDLLYQIDPRPYQHAYEQAVGQLQQAKANEQFQEVTFTRQERLRDTGVIAKEDYDTALSNKNQAEAQVVSAQAAVDSAALNLEFTRVISPINGRVSRQLAHIGNLVQADRGPLTTDNKAFFIITAVSASASHGRANIDGHIHCLCSPDDLIRNHIKPIKESQL